MNDLIKALHDPTSIYRHPMQVVDDINLTRDQKIKILRQWEYDARQLEIADQENMISINEASNPGYILHQVLLALHTLGEQAMGLDILDKAA